MRCANVTDSLIYQKPLMELLPNSSSSTFKGQKSRFSLSHPENSPSVLSFRWWVFWIVESRTWTRSNMCKLSYWVPNPVYEIPPYVEIKATNPNISKYHGIQVYFPVDSHAWTNWCLLTALRGLPYSHQILRGTYRILYDIQNPCKPPPIHCPWI